jgi:glycogen(starch) synthase
MRVLMAGWEFPPRISGGLGTACRGLVLALDRLGVEVTLVLPRLHGGERAGRARLLGADGARNGGPRVRAIPSPLRPYLGALDPLPGGGGGRGSPYGPGLLAEVRRYGAAFAALAEGEEFDVVHGHDWMTFAGAEAAARGRGVPLVLHFHSCEGDRSGPAADPRIAAVERRGAAAADAILCVSRGTAERVVRECGAPPGRITVVHNAALLEGEEPPPRARLPAPGPVVLFLGRVTGQKGPEHFLQAAVRVAREEPEARFVVAGDGDLLPRMVERAALLGLARRTHFTGFLDREGVERAYAAADVCVLPSVSEPFGITALEAMVRGVPTVVSRQSGVSGILRNVLRNDFWDADGLAGSILSLLRDRDLRDRLAVQGRAEARGYRWERQAARVLDVYREATR